MRVSNKTFFDTARFNLANLTDDLNRANMVVSSSNRLLKLSDDPVGLIQVLNMRSSLSNMQHFLWQIMAGIFGKRANQCPKLGF